MEEDEQGAAQGRSGNVGMTTVDQATDGSAGVKKKRTLRDYQRVRERVTRMRALASLGPFGKAASPNGQEDGQADLYRLLDAAPDAVAGLRRHVARSEGHPVPRYTTARPASLSLFEERLRAQLEVGGEALLVPEPRILGGFGFEINGGLFNSDTLKFNQALSALHRGGILGEFQTGDGRKMVWEIGAGWGGFAYQFKTLCPNVTYVISDYPERFLASAVYLLTAFPNARMLFFGDVPEEDLFQRWHKADFIFIPYTHLNALSPIALDLTLSLGSFEDLSGDQVYACVERAFRLRCPYLYALQRDPPPDREGSPQVASLIEQFYWPHRIPVLPVSYTQRLERRRLPGKVAREVGELLQRYQHIIGWKRLLVGQDPPG